MIKTWISSVGATMIFKRMHHCGRGHWLTSGRPCTVRGWLWSCSLFPHGFWLTKLCLLPRSQALTSFCRWLWVFWTVYGGAFWCYARYSSPFHTSPTLLQILWRLLWHCQPSVPHHFLCSSSKSLAILAALASYPLITNANSFLKLLISRDTPPDRCCFAKLCSKSQISSETMDTTESSKRRV